MFFSFSFLKSFGFTDLSYILSLAIITTSFTFVTLALYCFKALVPLIVLVVTLSSLLTIYYLLYPVFEQASQKIKRTKVRVFYNNHNPTNSYIILDNSPNKLSDLQKTRGWGFEPETAWEFEQ